MANKSEMRQSILEGRLAKEEEKTRKKAAAVSELNNKMDIDPLDDTPAEAEFLQMEARLAAEAQARATGLLAAQGAPPQEADEEADTQGGITEVGEAVGGEIKLVFLLTLSLGHREISLRSIPRIQRTIRLINI